MPQDLDQGSARTWENRMLHRANCVEVQQYHRTSCWMEKVVLLALGHRMHRKMSEKTLEHRSHQTAGLVVGTVECCSRHVPWAAGYRSFLQRSARTNDRVEEEHHKHPAQRATAAPECWLVWVAAEEGRPRWAYREKHCQRCQMMLTVWEAIDRSYPLHHSKSSEAVVALPQPYPFFEWSGLPSPGCPHCTHWNLAGLQSLFPHFHYLRVALEGQDHSPSIAHLVGHFHPWDGCSS